MSKPHIDVDHIAKLARIHLTDEERARMEQDLPAILSYVETLNEVDTTNVEAREYLTDLVNQFRQDEIGQNEQERQAIIDNFPKKTGDALEGPAVFE